MRQPEIGGQAELEVNEEAVALPEQVRTEVGSSNLHNVLPETPNPDLQIPIIAESRQGSKIVENTQRVERDITMQEIPRIGNFESKRYESEMDAIFEASIEGQQ